MRSMNDVVKDRFGSLLLSLCDMETVIEQLNARIMELEQKLAELHQEHEESKEE